MGDEDIEYDVQYREYGYCAVVQSLQAILPCEFGIGASAVHAATSRNGPHDAVERGDHLQKPPPRISPRVPQHFAQKTLKIKPSLFAFLRPLVPACPPPTAVPDLSRP